MVKSGDGTPVYLSDIADLELAPLLRQEAVTRDGEREAVAGIVLMLLGENSREVARRVDAKVAEIEKTLRDVSRRPPAARVVGRCSGLSRLPFGASLLLRRSAALTVPARRPRSERPREGDDSEMYSRSSLLSILYRLYGFKCGDPVVTPTDHTKNTVRERLNAKADAVKSAGSEYIEFGSSVFFQESFWACLTSGLPGFR